MTGKAEPGSRLRVALPGGRRFLARPAPERPRHKP